MFDVRLEQITKRFGALTAVDRVDLTVEAGEVVCLLGPSGCGKTTTLRMIAGLEIPTEGEIHIGERRVTGLAARQRDIAMVFQFYALYPSLSVAENIAYPLHAERLAADEMEKRVARVAALLHLEEVLQRKPGQLAEGEKQRVAVARAIVRDPTCFLFDEPLSRLDVQLRETMRGQIKELLAGLNKATVIVTHDQLEALTMADRIAVMRDGVIEQVASPHEIFARPSNLFVAGFIGTPQMNLLPATLTESAADGCHFRIGDQDCRLPTNAAVARLPAGSAVTLGARPRAFDLASEAGPDTLAAEVDLIEPMGPETLLHLRQNGQDLRVVVRRGAAAQPGERVHIRLGAGQAHVFDGREELVQ